MRHFLGYCRTFWNYVHTPKGSHDFRDDLKAIGWILLTSLLVGGILSLVGGV